MSGYHYSRIPSLFQSSVDIQVVSSQRAGLETELHCYWLITLHLSFKEVRPLCAVLSLCYCMSLETFAVSQFCSLRSHLKLKSPLIKKDFNRRRLRPQRPWFPQLCSRPLREVVVVEVGNSVRLRLLKDGWRSRMENVKCACLKKENNRREWRKKEKGWGSLTKNIPPIQVSENGQTVRDG